MQTIDAKQATGKYHQIWIEFAKFYEEHDQLDEARLIFQRSLKATYKNVDELATICCEWAEMELKHGYFGYIIELLYLNFVNKFLCP